MKEKITFCSNFKVEKIIIISVEKISQKIK